jgi:hypothetical protein
MREWLHDKINARGEARAAGIPFTPLWGPWALRHATQGDTHMHGNRLTIVVEVPPRCSPTTTDPHTPAEEIVETFNEWADANGMDPIDFVSAEWGHHLEVT